MPAPKSKGLPIPRSHPPMEARLVEELPTGPEWQYEPKWDGFRCLAFRDDATVDLMSKAGKPLGRYFPELVERMRALPAKRFVLDGEIVVPHGDSLSFDELLLRIHPASSRVAKLAAEIPDESPGAPLLRFKLARIYQHLRDYPKLEGELAEFVRRFPAHPYAAEGRTLLERIKKRGTVEPGKIGVVLPLSGNATYKRAGEQYLAGLKLALDGAPVQLVVRDSKGEPADAAAAVEALVYEDHVIAVVGGVVTAEAQGEMPVTVPAP